MSFKANSLHGIMMKSENVFQALIHTRMRKNADSLLATMEATQANPKRAKKLYQNAVVLPQSKCVVPPAMYSDQLR